MNKRLHKYNLMICLIFIGLSVLNFFTTNSELIYGLIFGYIYSCLWTYIYDRDSTILDANHAVRETGGKDGK